MENTADIVIIISAFILIVSVMLQNRGTGVSGVFGGGGTFYKTKRGIEKKLFTLTIISSIIFLTATFLKVII